MQVILKRTFFAGGARYRENGKFPIEIPERFRKILPKDAVIVGEEKKVEVQKVSPAASGAVTTEDAHVEVPKEDATGEEPYVNPALDLDPDRAFADAFSDVNKKAADQVEKDKVEALRKSRKETK